MSWVLRHRCENLTDPSVVGPNPTWYGSPSIVNAEFGKGLDLSTTAKYGIFPAIISNLKGTLRLWWIADTGSPYQVGFWNDLNYLFIASNGGDFYFQQGNSTTGQYSEYGFSIPFSIGEDMELEFTWDGTASAGNRLCIYKNGTPISPSSLLHDGSWTDDGSLHNLETSWVTAGYATKGIADNIGLADDVKTDFSDRFWEDYQGIPTGLSASKGTYTDHVAIAWTAVVGDSIQYMVSRATSSGGSYTDIGTWQSGITYSDSSPTDGMHYFYKVRSRSTRNNVESAVSAYDEGYINYIPPPPPGPKLIYDIPSRKKPQILINGFDVYGAGLVAKLFNVSEEKTFKKSKLIFNDFNLDCKNFTDVFSRDNPKSIFYGERLYMPVEIYNRDNKLIFQGVTLNLSRDHVAKTASIEISDTMATFARTKVEYVSADWETPAMAVKNLMDKYGASNNYDLASINKSDALYVEANAYIKCDIKLNDNTYLTNFVEKVAEIGCADAYIHNNLIRFEHWQIFTTPASSLVNININKISKTTPLSAPKISILFQEVVNDYRIRYTGDNGIAITDETANNIGALSRQNLAVFSLPEIRTTETAQVSCKDITTAIYFGECLIRRTHTNLATNPNPLQVIEMELPIQDREWLDITSHFSLTFSEEGWFQKPFEMMKIEYDEDANKINLTAYEVSS